MRDGWENVPLWDDTVNGKQVRNKFYIIKNTEDESFLPDFHNMRLVVA